ncbi:MAG: DUF2218 domain-containing protein [Thermomicrobia bacterium]|nr:DUF2218 domain-containing protein [Thermomicrobia bacterium]
MIAEARIPTAKPAISLRQLCAHFGYRLPTECTEKRGSIRFQADSCALHVEPGALVVRVEAGDQESLERLERVVCSHLEQRVVYRDNLQIQWIQQG